MEPDINHVLRIYLGTDENGGYEPLYKEERMKQAFADGSSRMMEMIRPYLDEDLEPDWTIDLIQQSTRFEAALREKFPELDAVVARCLANRWHFGASR